VKILHFLGIGKVPKQPMVDPVGGTERVALEIAKRQAANGHKVTIASVTNRSWSGTWEGVSLLHLTYHWKEINLSGRSRDFRVQLRLAAFARAGQFDVIHLHEHFTRRLLPPTFTVIQFHNNPLDGYSDKGFVGYAPYYWREIGKSDAQIAVSEFVAERLRSVYRAAGSNFLPEKVVVNQSGVDLSLFASQRSDNYRSEIRRRLGLEESDVLFLFVGAVHSEKGVDVLARAFSRLAEQHRNACLAIVGASGLWINPADDSTEEQTEIERYVLQLLEPAIGRKQAFNLGMIAPKDIPSFYAAADVLVLPTICQEAFGLVILEAFATARPVIGSRSGGIPELVKHRENGLIVGLGDDEELYQAMRELLLDEDLRLRLGRDAERTASKFPWENTVQRLEEIYKDVFERRRSRDNASG
jgi:glycosyltransferase involved in cell wall biosynthesis